MRKWFMWLISHIEKFCNLPSARWRPTQESPRYRFPSKSKGLRTRSTGGPKTKDWCSSSFSQAETEFSPSVFLVLFRPSVGWMMPIHTREGALRYCLITSSHLGTHSDIPPDNIYSGCPMISQRDIKKFTFIPNVWLPVKRISGNRNQLRITTDVQIKQGY